MIYRFDGNDAQGVCVSPECLYQKKSDKAEAEQSYGFLTEQNRKQEKQLQIPELNSGYDTVYWCRGCDITQIAADEHGCYAKWDGEGEIPITFVADVPKEGNYQVRIKLYAAEEITEAMIFLGRRRLAWRGMLGVAKKPYTDEKGMNRLLDGYWEGTFVTNICPIIPRTFTEPMEDLTLDVTVIGRGVHLAEVEVLPWEGRTLYIAGDSTVTDQSADYPYLPGSSYCGWGQMISAYLGNVMAVSNHAHSGLTTESFRSEGHYEILHERIGAGDICLIQFGHNDQKLMHLMADGGYRENLIRYIEELKKKQVLPVIVTPLARNSWRGDDGAYNDLLEHYAAVCRQVAKEYEIPLLDLHEKSMEFVKTEGRDSAMRYFYSSDYTHSNDYGAYRFAGYVYEEMVREGFLASECCKSEKESMSSLAAWNPPAVLPQLTIPEEFVGIENPNEEKLFENLERPEDELTRAEALELVVTTMHFFPTNVYNDMFEDVIGHETYAGTVECAWQNGLIPETMIEEHKFFPQRKVTGREFIEILKQGYKSRRVWTKEHEDALMEGIAPDTYLKRSVAAEMCKKSAV